MPALAASGQVCTVSTVFVGDYIAGHHSKGDLRGDEPDPIDPGVKRRVDEPECRTDQTGPKKWSQEAAPKRREARRQHRQQNRVKQTDEERDHAVADQRDNETCAVESRSCVTSALANEGMAAQPGD